MNPLSPIQTFYRYFPVSNRDRLWGFHITTAGESRIPPHVAYPPVGHPEGFAFDWTKGRALESYTIVYIACRRGCFESRLGGLQRVESGNAFIIHPRVWHRYRPDPATGWQEYWVGFDGPIPRQWDEHGFFPPQNPVIKVHREDLLLNAFTTIIDTVRTAQPALQQVIAGATGHILSLLYSSRHTHLDREQEVSAAIREALHLMSTQPEAALDMRVLSRRLRVSYTWFRRSFLQHTGLSPYQYLLQLRVSKARELLSETRMTIQQVAMRSGFESEQYFCRLFKNKTGLTPGKWRQQSREPATSVSLPCGADSRSS